MARLGRSAFRALAVVFHLIYIYSIFDIYFVSPVVHGMRAHEVQRPGQQSAPSQRLVLFVADGLRADKAFQSFPDPTPGNASTADLHPRPLAPFLRSRVLSHGTFGVSHTRVPTESRPGHVALIAGLYEDVSAVTTGWKLNPVNFDSVFNRSRHTWSWGSPDILPMFQEGAVPGRVDGDTYGADFEDYTQDATQLDTWVFDKVKALLGSAKHNATLNAALRQDKLVFFLHLLGLDTTGHAYRPYSWEYLHNIKVVDQGVAEITKLIEDFYADGKTSFVFTADHGMSDWGSHGDGHPDNTRTPLIAWGSGVAKPKIYSNGKAPGHHDAFSSDWNLDHVQRHDVAQADIAALMAYLAGLEFPVNSVGELPLSYLSASSSEKAAAALANAKGVLEMYRVKEEEKASSALRFRPYPGFAGANKSIVERMEQIEVAINENKYEKAISLSADLLQHAVEGLRYLQTYDWLFLRALITVGYLGWMAFALTTVVDLHVLPGSSIDHRTTTTNIAFSSLLVLLFAFLVVQKAPLTYYAYAVFPVLFWEEVFTRRHALVAGAKVLFSHFHTAQSYLSFAIQVAAFLAILEALVQSYFHRIIFTVCYILVSAWPFVYGAVFCRQHMVLVFSWAMGCLILSVFTLLPVIKVESNNTITAGGLLMLGAGIIYLVFEEALTTRARAATAVPSTRPKPLSRAILGCQVGVVFLTTIVTRSSVASIQAKRGLPLGNQVVGWLALIASLILPFVHRLAPNNHDLHRLVVVFLAFAPSFILLTISWEGIFYFAFCSTLVAWVRLEHAIHLHTTSQRSTGASDSVPTTFKTTSTSDTLDLSSRQTYRTLTLSDFRTALFFFFFLQSGFFSRGNIASVSSFSLDAVYRLIPVFDPFSQGALLLLNLLIPFAVISANLGILNRSLGLPSSALFMVVICISDVMTLNFFWMVRDEGSWLEIGTTISHFFIASILCVFVSALEGLSEVLISGVEVDAFQDRLRVEKSDGNGKILADGPNGTVSKESVVDERPVID